MLVNSLYLKKKLYSYTGLSWINCESGVLDSRDGSLFDRHLVHFSAAVYTCSFQILYMAFDDIRRLNSRLILSAPQDFSFCLSSMAFFLCLGSIFDFLLFRGTALILQTPQRSGLPAFQPLAYSFGSSLKSSGGRLNVVISGISDHLSNLKYLGSLLWRIFV